MIINPSGMLEYIEEKPKENGTKDVSTTPCGKIDNLVQQLHVGDFHSIYSEHFRKVRGKAPAIKSFILIKL